MVLARQMASTVPVFSASGNPAVRTEIVKGPKGFVLIANDKEGTEPDRSRSDRSRFRPSCSTVPTRAQLRSNSRRRPLVGAATLTYTSQGGAESGCGPRSRWSPGGLAR